MADGDQSIFRGPKTSGCDGIATEPSAVPEAPVAPLFARLPRGPAAVMAALHLAAPDATGLAELSEREWHETLHFAHMGMVGLELRKAAARVLPVWVRQELDACAERNVERTRRLRRIYSEIQQKLEAARIPFIALKGITH